MIQVFGYPKTRSTRVTWLLEELGVDYAFELVDLARAEHRSEAYLAINPAGKIPAMRDGELLMSQSAAMVTYLCDKYADRGLIPAAGTPERALHEQWCYFALCDLEPPLWTMSKHTYILPEEDRVASIIPVAKREFQNALAVLSQGLGDKNFIMGDSFSAADILLGQTLIWAVALKEPVEQGNLCAYVDRLRNREALKRAYDRELAQASS